MPRRHLLDGIVATWCALWILCGWFVHHETLGLRKLSATVVVAGQALDATARQIDAFSNLPVVGSNIGDTARQAHRAAVSARYSGRESRKSISSLANWLWFAVSAIAILPVLLVYALLRTRRL